MKTLRLSEWILIFTLVSLTALGPLAIDMYLPAFPTIAVDLATTLQKVQISLSTFLGGLAIGQLFWGPLSDRFGAKKPILISLSIFILASYACIHVETVTWMWFYRFLQAFGSSGGLVIARAIVNKRFEKDQTLKIFSILALIGGIAPILAPILGNIILQYLSWRHVFSAMALFAVGSMGMVFFFLKEDFSNRIPSLNLKEVFQNYVALFDSRHFITYTLIGSIAFSCLMLYISNSPVLIMEFGGLDSAAFSFIFGLNSCGLLLGALLTSSILSKKMEPKRILQWGTGIQALSALILLVFLITETSIYLQLIPLFFFVMPLGMLFPTSTALAMQPFKLKSGTASALFGASQLAFTFLTSVTLNSLNNGSMPIMAFVLFLCALTGFIINQLTFRNMKS